MILTTTHTARPERAGLHTKGVSMPGKNLPILVPQLRGGGPYDRYLDALLAEATNRGHPVTNRTQLAELALNRLGETWGIKAPRRAKPVGANQHGEPQAK